MAIVKYTGDYDKEEEEFTEEDMYSAPVSEKFSTIIKRARAKLRDGETLDSKESWAMTQACKIVPPQHSPRGPGKNTRKNLEKIVRYQFEDGMSLAEISEKEGKSYAWASKLMRDNDDLYRKTVLQIANDAVREAKMTVPIVNARLMKLMRAPAMRAPLVMAEIMDDPQQPGGVRANVAKDFIKKFELELEKESSTTNVQINVEQLKVINDTIGIMKGREIIAEAEIIND